MLCVCVCVCVLCKEDGASNFTSIQLLIEGGGYNIIYYTYAYARITIF